MSESSWEIPKSVVGTRVYDVNGERLGRVAEVDPVRRELKVEIAPREALRIDAPSAYARIAFDEIVDADENEVTLREEARSLVHPERRVIEPEPESTDS